MSGRVRELRAVMPRRSLVALAALAAAAVLGTAPAQAAAPVQDTIALGGKFSATVPKSTRRLLRHQGLLLPPRPGIKTKIADGSADFAAKPRLGRLHLDDPWGIAVARRPHPGQRMRVGFFDLTSFEPTARGLLGGGVPTRDGQPIKPVAVKLDLSRAHLGGSPGKTIEVTGARGLLTAAGARLLNKPTHAHLRNGIVLFTASLRLERLLTITGGTSTATLDPAFLQALHDNGARVEIFRDRCFDPQVPETMTAPDTVQYTLGESGAALAATTLKTPEGSPGLDGGIVQVINGPGEPSGCSIGGKPWLDLSFGGQLVPDPGARRTLFDVTASPPPIGPGAMTITARQVVDDPSPFAAYTSVPLQAGATIARLRFELQVR